MKTAQLSKIANKFSDVEFENNFYVGGGLDSERFASNRHENAKSDSGKMTIGKAAQLFKKATKLSLEDVKEIINIAVPCPEWHHAGKLPKSYGGGMKKTYFLNAKEIVDICKNWNEYEAQLLELKLQEKNKIDREERKRKFLSKYADKVERVTEEPKWFYRTKQEMNGKYGWFDSSTKDYNLTEYFSGYRFRSKKKYEEFLNL